MPDTTFAYLLTYSLATYLLTYSRRKACQKAGASDAFINKMRPIQEFWKNYERIKLLKILGRKHFVISLSNMFRILMICGWEWG